MSVDPSVLVSVKELREQRALRNVRQARDRQQQAQAALEQAKKALEDYRIWRPKRERELYDQIHGQHVKRHDLDDLKTAILKLRERELALIDTVHGAEKAVEQAKSERLEAEKHYKFAQAEKQKIDNLTNEWREQMRRERERLSDLELEEYQRVRRAAF